MISMHQSAFLRSLAEQKSVKVTLIVERRILEARLKMGWKIPELGNVDILSFEDNIDWRALINKSKSEESVHIFSGIPKSGKMKKAFSFVIKDGTKIGIMAESLDERGFTGKIRLIISKMNFLRYNKRILLWLTIGENAYDQYKKVGYAESKLYNWAYCVENLPDVNKENNCLSKSSNGIKIMYVGSLFSWKGYDLLIDALESLKEYSYKADFYSIEKNSIGKDNLPIRNNDKISFLPMLENNIIREKMKDYDFLVLPSRYDGWGVVINEALMAGTPVIVSDACGASTLVRHNSQIGEICNSGSISDLKTKIQKFIKKGKQNDKERDELISWARQHISGESFVDYFLNIISCTQNPQLKKPEAPWTIK
jgi:glycosyltransferase involved in cell wall biosynthesis